MTPTIPTVQVSPAGSGQATVTLIDESTSRYDWTWYVFKLTWAAAAGWHYKETLCTLLNGTVTSCDDEFANGAHDEYGQSGSNVVSIVVVFESDGDTPPDDPTAQKFTVSVAVSPQNAGTATGGGRYESGASVVIGAKAHCSPWTFDHWEITPGDDSDDATTGFFVTDDTVCTAYFTHSDSGRLYDHDGKILCNGNGTILHDS